MPDDVISGFIFGVLIACSACLPNDQGNQQFGMKAICVSDDFTDTEKTTIEKSANLWDFQQKHFVFNCDPGAIIVNRDSQDDLQRRHPNPDGKTIGLTILDESRVLLSDTLHGKWLALISAHEMGHAIFLPDTDPVKSPGIMNGCVREDVLEDLRLRKSDLIEYCKVWNCQ